MNNINQDVENKLYTMVADEIESKQIDRGMYAKALSESKGDKTAAEAQYIKFRVDQLKFEIDKAELSLVNDYKKKRDSQIFEAVLYGFIILVIVTILVQSAQ